VTLRFVLPEGVAVADLPVPSIGVRDGIVEVQTMDEVRVLHDLTGWALAGDHRLIGLSVSRVTLEDIYLSLTRDEQGLSSEVSK
jgi:hypothetical protein